MRVPYLDGSGPRGTWPRCAYSAERPSDRQLVSGLSNPGQSCLSLVVELPRTLGELTELADATNAFAVDATLVAGRVIPLNSL